MKDIIANRRRLQLGRKVRLAGLSLRENGVAWTVLTGCYYLSSALAEKAFSTAEARRRERGLPGLSSPRMNREIWNAWDWSAEGEEWTMSPEWKDSVLAQILRPNVPEGCTVLEIGPGGGRWTVELQARAGRLIGIDISEAAVRACQKRFSDCDNVEFRVGTGADLAGVANCSIDRIWSFDAFVHINSREFGSYAMEFARVLSPGGLGIIHHGTTAGATGGWRSDLTGGVVRELLSRAGLEVTDQFSQWADATGSFDVGRYEDALTIFRKPGEPEVSRDDGRRGVSRG